MTVSSGKRAKKILILVAVLGLVLLDRYVKHRVQDGFTLGESLPIIENVFHITYVRNTGAAFNMFSGMQFMTFILPSLITVVCFVALLVLYRRDDCFLMFAVGLILSGGIGNLIDRFSLGYVVDMFDFRVFPVFNVADICVTCGCALIVIWALIVEPRRAR